MRATEERITDWRQQGRLAELDAQFARMLVRLHPDMSEAAALSAGLVSRALTEGHTSLPLSRLEQELSPEYRISRVELKRSLLTSGAAVLDSEAAQHPAPLVLGGEGNLSLLRWHLAESRIAKGLLQRAEGLSAVDIEQARTLLSRLFPLSPDEDSAPDLQKCAVALALCKPLLILCGGPGTGKTWTLVRILALLTALSKSTQPLRIALAAPTGRAAMRLGESIREAASSLPPDFAVDDLPVPQTLHRLLGYQPASGAFRRNADNPLAADLVVVDEASMVDSALLDALLSALPTECRLILCGDPGQLPPVAPGSLLHALEAGADNKTGSGYSPELHAVLQELCGSDAPAQAGSQSGRLEDCRIQLRRARRFDRKSGIAALAAALQESRPAAALKRALAQDWPDIQWFNHAEAGIRLPALMLDLFAPLYQAESATAALEIFATGRVLCALREGPWGVSGLNALCQNLLRRHDLIPARQDWYQGLPVLIQHNDAVRNLYNGDTGLFWPDDSGTLKTWFAAEEGLRGFPPANLPFWLPAWAMTVHKSQGAEFGTVVLVLPESGDSALLGRDLLYTAITRAKRRLVIVAEPEMLHRIASRRQVRHSALESLLMRKSGV